MHHCPSIYHCIINFIKSKFMKQCADLLGKKRRKAHGGITHARERGRWSPQNYSETKNDSFQTLCTMYNIAVLCAYLLPTIYINVKCCRALLTELYAYSNSANLLCNYKKCLFLKPTN